MIQGSRTSWLCNSNQRPERCEGGQVNTKQRDTRGLIHFCVCVCSSMFFCFSHRDIKKNPKKQKRKAQTVDDLTAREPRGCNICPKTALSVRFFGGGGGGGQMPLNLKS